MTHQQEIRSEGSAHSGAAPVDGHGDVGALRAGGDRQLPELGLLDLDVVVADALAAEVLGPVRVLVVDDQQRHVPAGGHRRCDPAGARHRRS